MSTDVPIQTRNTALGSNLSPEGPFASPDKSEAYESFRNDLAEALHRICTYRNYDFTGLARALNITVDSLLYLLNQSDMRLSSLISIAFTLNTSVTLTFSDESIETPNPKQEPTPNEILRPEN